MTTTRSAGGRRFDGLWRVLLWGGVATLLLIPAIGRNFTDDIAWTAFDFIVAGAVLGTAGLICEAIMWKSDRLAWRLGAGIAVLACVLLFWVTGAVGIVGSENEPINMAYLGVIGVVATGAVLSRFRAVGLSRTLMLAAAGQVGIAVYALAMRIGVDSAAWPRDVIGATGLFTLLWLLSASLFWTARERG